MYYGKFMQNTKLLFGVICFCEKYKIASGWRESGLVSKKKKMKKQDSAAAEAIQLIDCRGTGLPRQKTVACPLFLLYGSGAD